ncbi:hypothetical protein H4582DRAFT_2063686 [Lactarius indigo]|nr:hypothetical protein H4582DRAFT_2063686 [Lactarius indigo]
MQVVYEAEAQWVATGKEDRKGKKKQSLDKVVQRLDDMCNTQEAHIAAMRDFVHNTDVILRALCTQGPGNVNMSTLRLQTPAVPLFTEPGPSTPSMSSVASGTSGAPSTVSSMGLGRMMISDAGVAGPSEVPPDHPQAPGNVQDVSEVFQAWDICNIYMRITSTSRDTGACIRESRVCHRTFPAWFPSKVSGCFRQGFQDQYGIVLKQSAHAPYWVHTQESQVMGTSRARSWNVLKHSGNAELLCVGVRTIQAVTHILYLLHAGNMTYTGVSNPEDDASSGLESFDEDDMYGSDNGDDITCNIPDTDEESQELEHSLDRLNELINASQSLGIVQYLEQGRCV